MHIYKNYPFEPLKHEKYDHILFEQWIERAQKHDSKHPPLPGSTAINYNTAFEKFLKWVKKYSYTQHLPSGCKECKYFSYEIIDMYPESPHTRKKKFYLCNKKRCFLKKEWWVNYL